MRFSEDLRRAAASFSDPLRMYVRFAFGLKGFLKKSLSLQEANTIVLGRMAERERSFLRLMERAVFGYSRSPYLPLLKLAGCEPGDIRHMLRQNGLEGTLLALRETGVYVTFEEFKGRRPIERFGQVIPVRAHGFSNPFLKRQYETETGGSTDAGKRVSHELDYMSAQGPPLMLARHAHGILDAPTALWRGPLPDGSGLNLLLMAVRSRNTPTRWFTAHLPADMKPALRFRLATFLTVAMGRLMKVPIPWPKPLKLQEARVLSRWACQTAKKHGKAAIFAPVSRAMRVSLAAQAENLDLTGVTFVVGGEPPTPAKVDQILASGARYFPTYALAEVSLLGVGCANPETVNEVHLMKDLYAVISRERTLEDQNVTVSAFSFTTLHPSTPTLMLNVEIDDCGEITQRRCGCPLETLGYTDHLVNIQSYSKLTCEGVTLLGSEMVRILEEVLPARFGGTVLDYQLLEEEGERGFTRLSIIVSPRIQLSCEKDVIDAFFGALAKQSDSDNYTRAVWGQTDTVRVKRMEPLWSARGKHMPLRVAKRSVHGRVRAADEF